MWMIRRRYVVAVIWLCAIVLSLLAAMQLSSLLSNRFEIPGAESQRVEDLMVHKFGRLSDGTFQVVATSKVADPNELVRQADSAAARAARKVPKSTVAPARLIADHVAVASIATQLVQAEGKQKVPGMRDAIEKVTTDGIDVYLTGQGAFAADLDPVLANDLKHGELAIALPIALVVLLFVFGSLGALIPFLFALAVIPVTLGVVYLFANVMDLSSYVLNMVVGVGLGVSIDYCLLMYYRYREERLRGDGNRTTPEVRTEAVARTMLTAGRAVVFSGTAVGIGLAVLLLMPLPFMQGFGIAGLIIPVVAVIASLTLMPGVLYMLAHRLERVRFVSERFQLSRDDAENSMWARSARLIMRYPLPVFLASSSVLILLALPAFRLELTPGSDTGVPRTIEAVKGLDIVKDALGDGGTVPVTVIVDTRRDAGATSATIQQAASRLEQSMRADREASPAPKPPAAAAPAAHSPARSSSPATPAAGVVGTPSKDGRYLMVTVNPRHDYGSPKSGRFVKRVRDIYVPQARFPKDARVYAGGAPGIGVDLIDTAYSSFPWIVAAVLILTFLLLMRAFRSLLLPLKAIILNLLSIGAAYGLLVLVFTTPVASAVGLQPADQIEFWIPVFMFAMLFGLSMDYEVFLVSRMREEWDEAHDNQRAVAMGLARTGRLVTAAGMIMVVAFSGFILASPVGFQQFGLGLSSAILIDVTIVRALLLPSAMRLFGRWNWWLPAAVSRVVRVEPSPLDRASASQ